MFQFFPPIRYAELSTLNTYGSSRTSKKATESLHGQFNILVLARGTWPSERLSDFNSIATRINGEAHTNVRSNTDTVFETSRTLPIRTRRLNSESDSRTVERDPQPISIHSIRSIQTDVPLMIPNSAARAGAGPILLVAITNASSADSPRTASSFMESRK